MAASYNPGGTDKDYIRFLLGDTDMSEPLVQDEEIEMIYVSYFPLYRTREYVASVVADNIAARYARETSFSADGVNINLAQVAQQYRDLAASLRQQHKNLLVGGLPDAGGITPGEQMDPSLRNFSFGTGMHDDIEAGQQDYGSRDGNWYPAENYPGV